jgi:FixJ family two-component response regulator
VAVIIISAKPREIRDSGEIRMLPSVDDRGDSRESPRSARYASLTPREQEVLTWVVSGRLNKQIAGELGISEETVKFHSAHVTQKMGAGSVAELVRISERLGLPNRRNP